MSIHTEYLDSNLNTGDEYRAQAKACMEERFRSMADSDTDGYLSQWASGQMASRYHALADLADNGGVMDTLALFFNGELASTDQRNGQYGLYWVLNDAAAAAYGKRFFNGSRSLLKSVKLDRAKGFTFGTLRVAAAVDRNSRAYPNREAIHAGAFEVVCTDGAYQHIEDEEAAK